MSHALEAGERILLIDPKDRRYLITLVAGATFHTHAGVIAHDAIIGGDEGRTITGSTGRHFLVLRPTLSDIVLKMPAGPRSSTPRISAPSSSRLTWDQVSGCWRRASVRGPSR